MTYERIPGCKLAIGLVGHARHGKDTAAKMLLELLPGSERYAFSDYVATVCRVSYGMTKREPSLLQQVGMEKRDKNKNVWLDVLYGHLQDKEPQVAILTGMRFHEEVDLLRAIAPNSIIIRVVREGFVTTDRDPNFRSEAQIDSIVADYGIEVPEGELMVLELQLMRVLESEGFR